MYFKLLPRLLSVFFLLMLISDLKCAPTIEKAQIDSGSIKQQFDYVIGNSTLYSEYRAVKAVWLGKLKTHSLDTIQQLKTSLHQYKSLATAQKIKIDSLSVALNQTTEKLNKTSLEKNTLRFFGIKIAKYQYNLLVVVTVLGLVALLLFGFIAYKKKNAVANQSYRDMANIKEEFDMFRKRALEREQKMARRHLDEILKYKDQSHSVGKKDK